MRNRLIESLETRTLFSVFHVDVNSPAANPTGATWATAFQDLQDAIAVANSGDQIWVADGTYKPTSGTDRSISFQLRDQVSIFGGYEGIGASVDNPDHRDIVAFPTILSGNIGDTNNKADNSYHVVSATLASMVTSATTLAGLTITAGYNNFDDPTHDEDGAAGGGLFLDQTNPTISNCTFCDNDADAYGGAAFLQRSASPTFIDCVFNNNATVSNTFYGEGGAVMAFGGTVDFTNCSFAGNSSVTFGGALLTDQAKVTLTRCTFTRNSAVLGGALSFNSGSTVTATGCQLNGNSASVAGGAVYVRDHILASGLPVSAAFTNCLMVGNSVTNTATLNPRGGGAMYIDASSVSIFNCDLVANSAASIGGAINLNPNGSFTLTNSIVRGNSAPTSPQLPSVLYVTDSDVEGGYSGTGNIDADAQFVRNPSPGVDGVWGTADDDYGDLREQITSPTLDVGDNSSVPAGVTTDLAGNTRFYDFPGVNDPGAIVDMGAYELTNHLPFLHAGVNQSVSLPAGGYIFVVDNLEIDSGGTIDAQNDDLIVQNLPLSSIQSLINSGRSGSWTGVGITSSAARNNPNGNTTLGAMTAADYRSIYGANAMFDGEAIADNSVLIKYTYYGDANFNGQVDGGDYARLDFTFGQEAGNGNIGGWINGDFNGDGKVDGSDFGLIDFAFGSQSGALRPGVVGSIQRTQNPQPAPRVR